MTEFDYDVKNRKALVPSARRKKNGLKSKKCTLPHEHMTKGELNKLNSAVVTINMNKPYTVGMLRLATKELQAEYIQNLRTKFKASTRMLGQMLGIGQPSVLNYLRSIGIKLDKKTAFHPTKADREAWELFLSNATKKEVEIPAQTEEIKPEPQKPQATESKPIENEKPVQPVIMAQTKRLVPVEGMLEYSGTVREICEALVFTLGADTVMNVSVRFNKQEELKCSEN